MAGRATRAATALAILTVTLVALPLRVAGDGTVRFGSHDARSVFSVSKSENRNQVHYGLRLDPECRPRGRRPVFAYWRMREEGPRAIEPLLERERPVYGPSPGQTVVRDTESGTVRLTLRALPDRPIAVESARREGRCTVQARTIIGGHRAVLHRVHAVLSFLGVDHLVVVGQRVTDGLRVTERLTP